MSRFAVGDIIVGTEDSNRAYSITNKKYGFVGKVTRVLSPITIEVEVIKQNDVYYIGGRHLVESHLFILQKDNTVTMEKLAKQRTEGVFKIEKDIFSPFFDFNF